MKKIIFLAVLFLFLNCSNVFGIEYFYDNFTNKDINKWDFNSNGGSIEIIDNNIFLSSTNPSFPYLISKGNVFPANGDFVFEIKFKYSGYGAMGDGISIGFTGVNNIFFEQFQLWRDSYHGAFLAYHDLNTNKYNLCNDIGSSNPSTEIIYTPLALDDNWHVLKIEKVNTKYNVYLDPDTVIGSKPFFISSDNQCIPKNIILGGIYTGGGDNWNNLYIDNINVLNESVIKKPKIIVLPGLGASWNTNAIVYNQTVGNNDWKMTPFVKNYDGLINALKQNDLVENTDFYVWNYDWRRPISEIESNLNDFINEKIGADEKIILIGHSLGGVVSRIWSEDHKDDSRLEKAISLAGPNLGSADVYEIWNGGQISDLTSVSSIAFKILLKIQGITAKTDMEAARNYAPVLKDLLPTFDYVTKNGRVLSANNLETNNTYLFSKNNVVDIGATLKLFVGNGFKTTDSINLKDNNVFDKILGIWPDGRIESVSYSTSGDSTVLVKSANYGKNDFVEINSDHGEIVNKTVNQVMTEIGLSQVDLISESQDFSNNLVVFVGSPVNYSVKCDNESPVNDIDGFVVIKNNSYNSCIVNLVGNGEGLIHVVIGNTNDGNWSYFEKNITNGEIDNIKINPTNGEIINNKDSVLFLKSMIKTDINSLLSSNKNNKYLNEALKNLDKNQSKNLIINIFGFRNEKSETLLSEKIINNATIWLSLTSKCSKNEATKGLKIINNYQDLIKNLISFKSKKNLKINENAAISFQKMNALLEVNKEKLDQKDYSTVCANNFTALNYGSEVLLKAYNKNDFKMWILNDLKI